MSAWPATGCSKVRCPVASCRMLREFARAASRVVPHSPIRLALGSSRVPVRARHALYWHFARRLPIRSSLVALVLGNSQVVLQPTGAGKVAYWTGCYEPEALNVFLRRAARARTVLDIGAYDAVYALTAAAVNPSAKVWAFEPDPRARSIAARNLMANPRARVRLVPIAFGDVEGDLPFFMSDGNSSLNEAFRPGAIRTTVEVHRGDHFLAREGVTGVDLIKIDTESTEPAVLEGLRGVIGRDHPEIICEVLAGRTESDLNAFVETQGYEAFALRPEGPRRVARITGDPSHRFVNYLFSHPASRFRSAAGGDDGNV